jgi:hypothetical protein
MSTTRRRFCVLTAICLAGGLWVHPGLSVAADDAGRLQPIPQPSLSAGETSPPGKLAGSPFHEESPVTTVEEDAGMDFCGLPICSPPGRFWLRAEYLMWATSGSKLPPLVTTSPVGTPVSQAGVLGQPGTQILSGDETIACDGRSGYRTTIGMWLDCCHRWDLEFDYFSLGQRDTTFSADSSTNAILARPFFNVQTNQEASELVSYPGTATGSISVTGKNYFQSAGASLSYNLCSCNSCCDPCDPCDDTCPAECCPLALHCCRTDLLLGLRYYDLNDSLVIHETPSLLATTPTHPVLATFDIHDNFITRNEFYGGEIGLRTELYRGRWSLNILTKIAVGNTHETVDINGQTNITAGGVTTPYNVGIFAGPPGTNSGTYHQDLFTLIPQLGLELGYQLTCHWRTYVGYDVLYWGSVALAGPQIDRHLDPRNFAPQQAGGLPFPTFPGQQSAFWAQGLHVGAEFRF